MSDILDEEILEALEESNLYSKLYIVGGYARYLYKKNIPLPKDIDLVLYNARMQELFYFLKLLNVEFKLNSCGGFKFTKNNITYDIWIEPDLIWFISSTPHPHQELLYSITYDKFIFTNDYLKQDKNEHKV
jgi:hypothetical protein